MIQAYVEEKYGFTFHHVEEGKRCLTGGVRTEYFSCLTKEAWERRED